MQVLGVAEGGCIPEPAQKICPGIRHAVEPFVDAVGLGWCCVEPRGGRSIKQFVGGRRVPAAQGRTRSRHSGKNGILFLNPTDFCANRLIARWPVTGLCPG
jgi:hypothetical protein